MKRCPTCHRSFADEQKFCATDGTPLVADAPPAFDPEATVMSLASQLNEEPASPPPSPSSPPPSSSEPPPTQYFNSGSSASPQAEPNIQPSYPQPPNAPGGAPQWSPAPQPPPQQQQQQPSPYYPQPGAPGGGQQQPAPPWQGGQQPPPGWQPQQQQGQPPPGQSWGGGYYPQQGQPAPYGMPYARPAKGGKILGILSLAFGVISAITLILHLTEAVERKFYTLGSGSRTYTFHNDGYTLMGAVVIGIGVVALALGLVGFIKSRKQPGGGVAKVLPIVGLAIGAICAVAAAISLLN